MGGELGCIERFVFAQVGANDLPHVLFQPVFHSDYYLRPFHNLHIVNTEQMYRSKSYPSYYG